MKKLNSPDQMLKHCLTLIQDSEQCDSLKAFKILLQYLALETHIHDVLFKCKIVTETILKNKLDLDYLKSKPIDWLGELYLELKPKSCNLISYEEAKTKAKIISPNRNNTFPQTILDMHSGTGRTLMAIHQRCKGNVLLYGIEKDKTLFRICLINMALYNINALLITQTDNINLETIEPNNFIWNYANNWFGNKN